MLATLATVVSIAGAVGYLGMLQLETGIENVEVVFVFFKDDFDGGVAVLDGCGACFIGLGLRSASAGVALSSCAPSGGAGCRTGNSTLEVRRRFMVDECGLMRLLAAVDAGQI